MNAPHNGQLYVWSFARCFQQADKMKQLIFITIWTLVWNAAACGQSPEEVVRGFLADVRSGLHPGDARHYMADTVLAHQVNAENPVTVKRTPDNYTNHVNEFMRMFGKYEFEVLELIASHDKVYVRWKQTGIHSGEIDGYPPTHLPLIELTSAVYRVADRHIVEYWIQTDRLGFGLQLKVNAASVRKKTSNPDFVDANDSCPRR